MGRGLKMADVAFLKNSGPSPADFPGLWRWYKADQYLGSGSDGQAIGGGTNPLPAWHDYSGHSDDATNPVTGPLYKTNIIGTMPIIRFNTEYLSFSPGGLGDFTLIAVHQKTHINCFINGDSFVANHQLRRDFGGDNTTLFYAGAGGVSPTALGAPNNFMAMTVRRSAGTVSFRENKTARGGGVEAGTWTVFELGSITFGGNLDFAEYILYKGTVLSDADVDFLYDNYLKPRWVTLP